MNEHPSAFEWIDMLGYVHVQNSREQRAPQKINQLPLSEVTRMSLASNREPSRIEHRRYAAGKCHPV